MNRRTFLQFGATFAAAPFVVSWRGAAQSNAPANPFLPLPPAGADGWVSLMNFRNLDGLYTMLQRSGKGVAEKIGMVTFENGMLHVMGNLVTDEEAEAGYIASNREFENYRVRVEYKWGVKRFPPRLEGKRDNGLLYHLVGEDRVWPTCVECQIQESDTCDYHMLGGVRGIQGSLGRATSGPPPEPRTGRLARQDGDFEIRDGWNVVEVVVQGDRSSQILNGTTLNAVSSIQQPDPQNPGRFIPLTRGKVAIEIEYAEIWYRRFEIKSLA